MTVESYAGHMPDAIDALGPQERYRMYRMIGYESVSGDHWIVRPER